MNVLITTLNSKYIHSSLSIKYIFHSISPYCHCEMKEYTINENMEDILSDIARNAYDVVGFSCYIWNIESILRICENLKKINPQVVIFLGGPEVSYDSREVLIKYPFIDYILAGEGELTSAEFIRALSSSNDDALENIEGLCFRQSDEQRNTAIKMIGEPAIVKDLSLIKSPYQKIKKKEIENKIIYYETSRGCVYNCSYCLSATTKGVRYFPLEQVKCDIQNLVRVRVRQIKFVDRTFNAEPSRTIELIRFFKSVDDGQINFHFEVTASLMSEELIDELKQAREGLFQLEVGVQSTNPFTLRAIRRQDSFGKLAENVKKIREGKNIHQHLDLIAGLPFENFASFRKSFHDVYRLEPDMLQLGFLKLLKGSPIRSQAEQFGYVYRDYPPYEVLSNNYMTAEEMFYLKKIENTVDDFYNSSLYFFSIQYLSSLYSSDYFQLYEELWQGKQRYFETEKLSRDEGFLLLLRGVDFFTEKDRIDPFFFEELLRFDYLRMGRNRVLPDFFQEKRAFITKEEALSYIQRHEVKNYFGMSKLHPLEIMKKVHVEKFRYDLIEYQRSGNIVIKERMIAFDYSGKKDINGKVHYI